MLIIIIKVITWTTHVNTCFIKKNIKNLKSNKTLSNEMSKGVRTRGFDPNLNITN
jgi:hypothetical protein